MSTTNLEKRLIESISKSTTNLEKRMIESISKLFDEQNKKIDKKFDNQDKKIDKKFDEQDKKIDKKFDYFETNIGTKLYTFEKRVEKIEGYFGIDVETIEIELNKIAEEYLKEQKFIDNYTIKKLNDRFFYSSVDRPNERSGDPITEFDGGAFIVSNNQIKDENYFIIIEAKHIISIDLINRKIIQIYNIKNDLENINKSKKKYKNFRGDEKDTDIGNIKQIYLFIGGPLWRKDAKQYIEDIFYNKITKLKWNNKKRFAPTNYDNINDKDIIDYIKKYIIYIIPKQKRYIIYDNEFEFNPIDNVIDTSSLIGGKRTKIYKGPMMKLFSDFDPILRKKIEG